MSLPPSLSPDSGSCFHFRLAAQPSILQRYQRNFEAAQLLGRPLLVTLKLLSAAPSGQGVLSAMLHPTALQIWGRPHQAMLHHNDCLKVVR